MNASFLGRLGVLPLGISAWIGLAATVALAAVPANDNFANAITISGVSGSTSGTNVGASTETGEPDLLGIDAVKPFGTFGPHRPMGLLLYHRRQCFRRDAGRLHGHRCECAHAPGRGF